MTSARSGRTQAFQFGWNVKTDTFWIDIPGFSALEFRACAHLDGKAVHPNGWKEQRTGTRRGRFVARTGHGRWTLDLNSASDGFSIEIVFKCELRRGSKTARLDLLAVGTLPADHLITQGRKMGGSTICPLKNGRRNPFESHFLLAATKGSMTLQFSHPMAQKDVSHFDGCVEGRKIRDLRASTLFERCRSRNLHSAPLTISSSSDGHQLMIDWADAQISGRKLMEVPQESGWNTWDYYRWTITEEEVLKNAEFIAADPVLSRHVKRIIIDDGWQYCYGEWEANSLFPSGMRSLSRRIRRMGFVPGLWFAPTIAEPHARLAQLNPEMLTRGVAGAPCLAFSCMERKGFVLDPTHPAVCTWWDELFRRYSEYGYRYFKLDFLAWTVRHRRFTDSRAKPGELMRRIVEPIRRAIGPESRILGCNYNFEDPAGQVDDVRVSSDIHSRWASVKENVAAVATRFWAHRRFWINDPDFALCRGDETSDDPDLHRLKPLLPFVRPEDTNPEGIDYMRSLVDLSFLEAEVLLSLVIVSGGAMNLSDNLLRLNPKGLGLLRKAVTAEKGNPAIPIDLFRSKYPSTWVQKLDSGIHRILLVNWGDRQVRMSLDLDALNVPRRCVRNFWRGGGVPVDRGRLSVDLRPHSCVLAESRT